MRTGKLRHRVQLQRVTETQDSYGGVVETWAALANLWVSIEALAGREYWSSQNESAEAAVKVRIRYRDGIQRKDRIVYGSHVYDIEDVQDPTGKRREMVLVCRELVA